MMHRILLLLSLVAVGFASGCTWSRVKVNSEEVLEKSKQIEVGKTKADELETILGSPPNSIIPLGGEREVQVYNFGDSKTNGLTLIVVNITKTNVRLDSAYFFIDADGVVERVSVSNNSEDVPWEWNAFED